jgi:hypothetical protein
MICSGAFRQTRRQAVAATPQIENGHKLMDMEMQDTDDSKSLQQRVDEYLRGKPKLGMPEESEEQTANAIFEMLQKAENNLKNAQARVDRLRWELARLQA